MTRLVTWIGWVMALGWGEPPPMGGSEVDCGAGRPVPGEEHGRVVVNLTDVIVDLPVGVWSLDQSVPGFSGRGWVRCRRAGNLYRDPLVRDAVDDPVERFIVPVWIENAGDYGIRVWNHHRNTDGDNDIWIGLDDDRLEKVWDHDADHPSWSEFQGRTWSLARGLHEVVVAARSPGFGISQLVVCRVWEDGPDPLPPSAWVQPGRGHPPAPRNLRLVSRKSHGALLQWEDERAADGVIAYQWRLAGGSWRMARGPEAVVEDLRVDEAVDFEVRGWWANGDVSPGTVHAIPVAGERPAPLTYLAETVTIDGEPDPCWYRVPWQPMFDARGLRLGETLLGWNEQHLFLLVVAPDAGGASVAELRLRLDPPGSQGAREGPTSRDYRFRPGEEAGRETIERAGNMLGAVFRSGRPLAPKRPGGHPGEGWNLEAKIPWGALGIRPRAGHLLGISAEVLYENGRWAGLSGSGPVRRPFDFPAHELVRSRRVGVEGRSGLRTWEMLDGALSLEAEDLVHPPGWTWRTAPEGFSGTGFLVWEGEDRTTTPDGRGGNDDYTLERIGPAEQWLVVRLRVQHPGWYALDVRNLHHHRDGDNDAWVGQVGRWMPAGGAIRRIGDSHQDGLDFTWADWGIREFWLVQGVNELFVAGRSRGFGVDRLAIWRVGDESARQRAQRVPGATE